MFIKPEEIKKIFNAFFDKEHNKPGLTEQERKILYIKWLKEPLSKEYIEAHKNFQESCEYNIKGE